MVYRAFSYLISYSGQTLIRGYLISAIIPRRDTTGGEYYRRQAVVCNIKRVGERREGRARLPVTSADLPS